MKYTRDKTLIYLHTTRGCTWQAAFCKINGQSYTSENTAVMQISCKNWKKKNPNRKATSSMKLQPDFLQATERPGTATSSRLVVSLRQVSNVILGRQITHWTPIFSLVTGEPVWSFSSVVPCSTHTAIDSASLKITVSLVPKHLHSKHCVSWWCQLPQWFSE